MQEDEQKKTEERQLRQISGIFWFLLGMVAIAAGLYLFLESTWHTAAVICLIPGVIVSIYGLFRMTGIKRV